MKKLLGGLAIIVIFYILANAKFTSSGEPIENKFIYLGRQLDEMEEKLDKIESAVSRFR